MAATNTVFHGECLDFLSDTTIVPDNYIDLIITSPPYADKRAKSYGGIRGDKYKEWFLPISAQLKRVLKEDGSFILNIKEHPQNGERQTYVIELIIALKEQGWFWGRLFL